MDVNSVSPPSWGEREQQARLDKLELEIQSLQLTLAPSTRRLERFKVFTGVGGLLAALVGLAGLFASSTQWLRNNDLSRQQRAEERLDHLLETVSAERPSTRLASIAALHVFVDGRETSRYLKSVLGVLSAVVGDDEVPEVRQAAVSFFRDFVGKLPHSERIQLGQILVTANRNLAYQANLLSKAAPLTVAANSAFARARDLATVMAILAREDPGSVSNLSHTYLADADFSGATVSSVNFSQSVLTRAKFTDATGIRANFDGAYLEDTNFQRADLRGASFRQPRPVADATFGASYVAQQLEANERYFILAPFKLITGPSPNAKAILIRGPIFRCADLRGARFNGHPLFLSFDSGGPAAVYSTRDFEGSDLEGADFTNTVIYGVKATAHSALPLATDDGYGYLTNAKVNVYYGVVSRDGTVDEHSPGINAFGRDLEENWGYCNWRRALLPTGVREAFAKHVRTHLNDFELLSDMEECKPRHSWPTTE